MEEEFSRNNDEMGKNSNDENMEIERNKLQKMKNLKYSFFEIKKKLILKEFINVLKNILTKRELGHIKVKYFKAGRKH